jgi:VWFA-related protein
LLRRLAQKGEFKLRFLSSALLICSCLILGAALNAAQQPASQPPRQRPRLVKPEQPTPSPTPADQGASEVSSDDVIRVETDLVNTLFTAIDNERHFVTNLRPDDIRIFENGVPQKIDIFQRETELPLSLAIVVDISKSQERTLPDEQKAAGEFLDTVIRADRDQAAAISFTGKALIEQELTNDKARLRKAINRLKVEVPPDNPDSEAEDVPVEQDPRGWSSIWDAVWASTNEVLSHTPERTRRAIILITDGYDTSSVTKKQEAIDFAVKNNVTVYGIGITDSEYPVDKGALRKVAENTGGRSFFPANDAELRAAFAQINQELRSQYLIAYSPQNKARDGTFRPIKIEIVNPQLRKQKIQLLYRQGYYARRSSSGAVARP